MYPVTATTTGSLSFVCGIVAMEITQLFSCFQLHDTGRINTDSSFWVFVKKQILVSEVMLGLW